MIKIQIRDGFEAIIDQDDEEMIRRYKWHKSHNGYAIAHIVIDGKKTSIRMHRLIISTPRGMVTDHRNGNPLDNRKENLRICTSSQNNCNRRPLGKSSKYKGVFWHKASKKWSAQITNSLGKILHSGCFNDEIDAATAYNFASIEHQGEFAYCNR